MEVYLVGGAVRDRLMGRTVLEKDWVVVGASPNDLLKKGYKQVGKDFPVFLHPKTKEEYALARTERKKGTGYGGFEVYFGQEVTLEEDLMRRDLTINAIAQSKNEQLIDPFSGKADIEAKILRHISPAFKEDPLRVLRLARFKSTFSDFKVADETCKLCQQMALSGELKTLTYERVWLEWSKVLKQEKPWLFVAFLIEVGAWHDVMKGFDMPYQDLERLKKLKGDYRGDELFCLLGQYLSKEALKSTLNNWKLAKHIKEMAILYHEFSSFFETWCEKRDINLLLKKYTRWDLFRRKERFFTLINLAKITMDQSDRIEEIANAAILIVKYKPALEGEKGLEARNKITQLRLSKLKEILQFEEGS